MLERFTSRSSGERERLCTVVMKWRELVRTVRHPYRPELHDMRGPSPKWRAKHGIPAGGALLGGRDPVRSPEVSTGRARSIDADQGSPVQPA